MQAIPFMVYDEPYYVVGYDIVKRNLDFLNRFQPKYFYKTGQYIFSSIESEGVIEINKIYSASLLRSIYGQAVETFFLFFSLVFKLHFV